MSHDDVYQKNSYNLKIILASEDVETVGLRDIKFTPSRDKQEKSIVNLFQNSLKRHIFRALNLLLLSYTKI